MTLRLSGIPTFDGSCSICAGPARVCGGTHYLGQGSTLPRALEWARHRGDDAELAYLQSLLRDGVHDVPAERRRSASAAPAGPAPADRLSLQWRDDPDQLVTIHAGAYARILAELRDTLSDGAEAGGFLFALGDNPAIEFACGAGPAAVRDTHSVRFDHSYRDAFHKELKTQWPDVREIGRWHSHPYRDTRPSADKGDSGDLAGARLMFEWREQQEGATRWVDVIATAPEDDQGAWDSPELHAYVVHRDPVSRQLICENAKIEEV